MQPRFTSPDGSPALISVNNHPSSSPSRLLDSLESTVMNNNSLLLGQSHSLQTDTCLTPNNSIIASTMGSLPGPDQNLAAMDQLVEVGDVEDTENMEGSVHRILLGNVQTIPIQIIDSHPTISKLKATCDFIFFLILWTIITVTLQKNQSFLLGFIKYKQNY